MSLFSKFLVAIVAAVIVYCLFPRDPSLARFSPETVADHELKVWRAIRNANGIKAAGNLYSIYDWQYRFNPVRALVLSRQMTSSIMGILKAPDEADQERYIPDLVEFYVTIRRDTGSEFDAATLGRKEFSIWAYVSSNAPQEVLTKSIAELWSQIYGVPVSSLEEPAKQRALALETAFGTSNPGEKEWAAAGELLSASWKGLRAVVPPPAK